MKHFISRMLIVVGLVSAFAASPLATSVAHAAPIDVFKPCSTATTESGRAFCNDQDNQRLFGPGSLWTNIINTIVFLVGSVAVIMIIVGGLRYVLSGGDSGSVNNAKNTILYAVVGLIVAAMAYAIVNFVLTRI